MSPETFRNRIENDKVNNYTYASNGNEGIISIWKYQREFILTWEECPAGEQYDESTFTRDERHVFQNIEELMSFLQINEIQISSFEP